MQVCHVHLEEGSGRKVVSQSEVGPSANACPSNVLAEASLRISMKELATADLWMCAPAPSDEPINKACLLTFDNGLSDLTDSAEAERDRFIPEGVRGRGLLL